MTIRNLVFAAIVLTAATPLSAHQPARGRQVERGIEYAVVDGHRLLLDLYLPHDVEKPRLIVWVHGGAWRSGSRAGMPLGKLVDQGFAIASVDYRLSPVAKFPALIHDCKAAIRFLRAKQRQLGFDATKIGIAGSSAGGHIVALIGVTNGHRELEGSVGEHLDQSSDVQAIADYYGPTNFQSILQQSTPHGLSVRVPALNLLLGDRPDQKPELARLASPVFHVDDKDPPLLIVHGDQDPQVPINQSHELHGRYKAAKRPVHFEVIHGGRHGGAEFYNGAALQLVRDFFDRSLREDS